MSIKANLMKSLPKEKTSKTSTCLALRLFSLLVYTKLDWHFFTYWNRHVKFQRILADFQNRDYICTYDVLTVPGVLQLVTYILFHTSCMGKFLDCRARIFKNKMNLQRNGCFICVSCLPVQCLGAFRQNLPGWLFLLGTTIQANSAKMIPECTQLNTRHRYRSSVH